MCECVCVCGSLWGSQLQSAAASFGLRTFIYFTGSQIDNYRSSSSVSRCFVHQSELKLISFHVAMFWFEFRFMLAADLMRLEVSFIPVDGVKLTVATCFTTLGCGIYSSCNK